jgi:hypothetical protein
MIRKYRPMLSRATGRIYCVLQAVSKDILPLAATVLWAIITLAGLNQKLTSISARILLLSSVLVAIIIGLFSGVLARYVRFKSSSARQVFLAYPQSAIAEANLVSEALLNAGMRVWRSEERIKPGDSIFSVTAKAIEDSDDFVVILADAPSEWLRREVKVAKEKRLKIVPVLVRGAKAPDLLSDVKAIDLQEDNPVLGVNELVSAISTRATGVSA